MSDRDAPDPADEAYLRAETIVDDEVARGARRARVLAAVGREATPAPQARRPVSPLRLYGGGMAAAAVVVLSVVVATQIQRPVQSPPRSPPQSAPPQAAARAPLPQEAASTADAAPEPEGAVASSRLEPVAGARGPRPPAPGPAAVDLTPVAPPPPPLPLPPVAAPQDAPPAPRAPAAEQALSSQAGNARADAGDEPSGDARRTRASASLAPAPLDPAARLRGAAAAGRIGEVEALLRQGVPVDAADDEGETALMQSVRADRPAVAALLRRNGASPDRTNKAGDSARTIVAAKDDPRLARAIAPPP